MPSVEWNYAINPNPKNAARVGGSELIDASMLVLGFGKFTAMLRCNVLGSADKIVLKNPNLVFESAKTA
jgi:hypothetical protein